MGAIDAFAKRSRIDRVASEAARIDRAARAWLARRRSRDARRLHRARLDALEGTILGAITRIRGASPLSIDLPIGALYRAAAAQERRLALVDRLLGFFRERFDARDDGALGPLLDGADEVVQSLYLQPFRAAGLKVPPPPLVYVEPAFSPRAVLRDEPPSELKTDDDVLRAALARLPFGVIGLPPWFEEGPWTMVYLAHEVGHHVHVDLAPGRALVKSTGDALAEAAAGAGFEGEGGAFRLWNKEIFADAFSIATLGPVAIEAIAELERGDDASMLVAGGLAYPRRAVRLAMMAAFARAIGLDPSGALGGIDPAALAGADAAARSEAQRVVAAQLQALPAAASALAGLPLTGARAFAAICDVRPDDFEPGGQVTAWAEALFARKKRPRDASLRGTRRVLAASWIAWRRACAIDDDTARADAIAALRTAAYGALGDNREPVTLGGPSVDESAALGRDLGDFLLARTPEELGL
jgi:hypothetical protein